MKKNNFQFQTIQVRPKTRRAILQKSAMADKKIYEYVDILIRNTRELNRLKKQLREKAEAVRP